MDPDSFAAVAAQVYSAPLGEFVAARTAAARAASGPEAKELAVAIRALPKPSVAAWTLNMLVRQRPAIITELQDLGTELRAAQAQVNAARLRDLAKERRRLVRTGLTQAREVAGSFGKVLSAATAVEIEATLKALTIDRAASAAVTSGLLVRTLTADGIDAVDVGGAVAVVGTPGLERTSTLRPVQQKRSTAPDTHAAAARNARMQAAKAQAKEAEAADLERSMAELSAQITAARTELSALNHQLKSVQKQAAAAAAEAKILARAARKSQRTADAARERLLRQGNTMA
ncbi:hypothetical protein [Pseudarthrobacter sp. PS3-L1]|uniref:hypothetical protein n=1 Tax=Pseudarthrobacter sp. PS3-L1 TaxID=3046207 RepID=UPI0024BB8B3D|nr:hypothetical protein [Pseudarthrobacter sp. PS3-L1]MDJ0320452.1 hypothetical protein [Pseudarthrobacter sp. PS3-L1]